MKAVICGIGGVVAGGYLGFRLACYCIYRIVDKNATDEELEVFNRIMAKSMEA